MSGFRDTGVDVKYGRRKGVMKKEESNDNSVISRRDLLGAAAAVAAFTYVPKRVLAASPNGKLNIAGIGVGGRGASDIRGVSISK